RPAVPPPPARRACEPGRAGGRARPRTDLARPRGGRITADGPAVSPARRAEPVWRAGPGAAGGRGGDPGRMNTGRGTTPADLLPEPHADLASDLDPPRRRRPRLDGPRRPVVRRPAEADRAHRRHARPVPRTAEPGDSRQVPEAGHVADDARSVERPPVVASGEVDRPCDLRAPHAGRVCGRGAE